MSTFHDMKPFLNITNETDDWIHYVPKGNMSIFICVNNTHFQIESVGYSFNTNKLFFELTGQVRDWEVKADCEGNCGLEFIVDEVKSIYPPPVESKWVRDITVRFTVDETAYQSLVDWGQSAYEELLRNCDNSLVGLENPSITMIATHRKVLVDVD